MASQVLRRLEGDGYLTRRPDTSDSRARRLDLTDRGSEVLRGALTDVEAADAAFFAPLHGESAAFLATLGELVMHADPPRT